MHKSNGDLQPTPALSGTSNRLDTDLSWLFFADSLVYKVKRPIKLNGRDYTTLDAREKACQRELRVNRAIAGNIYQDVVPLFDHGGSWSLHGEGEPCEFGICMSRLPLDRMLGDLIRSESVSAAERTGLAETLAQFYQSARSGEKIARAGSSCTIESNVRCALKTIRECGGAGDVADYLESAFMLFLARHQDQFEKRATQNKIRDGHGELRAGHVCMSSPPVLIDRLEYCDRVRHRDVIDDVAGLLVDIDLLGKPQFGRELWAELAPKLGEKENEPLLEFYRAYQALVRAKHEFLLPKNRERGRQTLQKAAEYCHRFHAPRFFVTIGLMGTGKTTLAQALAQDLGMRRISATQTREKLFPTSDPKAKPVRLTPQQMEQLYATMCADAATSLKAGVSVILDADFLMRDQRAQALSAATQSAVAPLFLECRISKNDAIARLDNRRRKDRTLARTRPELYEEQLERCQPVDDIPADSVLPLNTNQPVRTLVDTVVKFISTHAARA